MEKTLNSQLSFIFEEDRDVLGTPDDIAKCDGATLVLDTETTGLRWWQDKLVGVGVYCPERNISTFIPEQYVEDCKREIEKIARNKATTCIGHNLKFDSHFLDLKLWQTEWSIIDTAVMAHLYDSRQPKALRELEKIYLGAKTKETMVKSRKGAMPWEMPLGTLAEYCLNDCDVTLKLKEYFEPKLAELKLNSLFRKEMRYAAFLQRVERLGMQLDREFVERSIAALAARVKIMEKDLFEKSGRKNGFNWHNPTLLGKVLYEGMGIKRPVNPFLSADGEDHTLFKTRGKYNKSLTNAFVLMEKANHPLGELVMFLRETEKLKDTLEDWLDLSQVDGTLHSNFNQVGTRTGRLSSSKPNLQNIASQFRNRETQSVYSGSGAIRSDEYNLRLGLIARPGYKFVSIDHKQQEMRMFAILAKEPVMLNALQQRLDIHREVAQAVWGIGDDLHREWSKTIGFGLIYGMRPGSLELRLNVSKKEAEDISNQYWSKFPRIKPFLQECMHSCEGRGYVRYWSNRIWREDDPMHMYKAANATIQGGSADILSIAAMRCQKYLDEYDAGNIVSLVHDEILAEVPEQKVEQTAKALLKIVEVEDIFNLPFAADAKCGASYGSLEKLKSPEN